MHRSGVNIPDRGYAVGFHMADDRDILIIDYYFDRSRNQTDLPVANNGSFLDRIIAWDNDWHKKSFRGFTVKFQSKAEVNKRPGAYSAATPNSAL